MLSLHDFPLSVTLPARNSTSAANPVDRLGPMMSSALHITCYVASMGDCVFPAPIFITCCSVQKAPL